MNKTYCIPVLLLTVAAALPDAFFVPEASAQSAYSARNAHNGRFRLSDFRYDRWDNEFNLEFSEEVDSAEFLKHLKCVPEVSLYLESGGTSRWKTLRGNFQAGVTYTISLSPELESTYGNALGFPAIQVFTIPDRNPDIDFLSSGKFFPLGAKDFSLPVSFMNTKKVRVVVHQAYGDCVPEFFADQGNRNYSKIISEKTVDVPHTRNKSASFSVDLEKIGIPRRPGLYFVEINDDDSWRWDKKTVIVTDLAVQAVRNGNELAVVLKNLSQNAVVPNATISVYSDKNRLITKATTDASGFVKIDIPALDDKADSPSFIVAESGDDKTYLVFSDLAAVRQTRGFEPGVDLTSEIGNATSLSAYLFFERGICRPGEKFHVFAGLRDREKKLAQGGVPAEFVITDPSGKVFVRLPVVGDKYGFYKAEFQIPDFAALGSYRASLRIPGQEETEFGCGNFSVAEFVPDSIKVSLSSARKGESTEVRGNAAYYFGLPVSEGKVSLRRSVWFKAFESKGDEFSGFEFGEKISNRRQYREAPIEVNTDISGAFSSVFEDPIFDSVPAAPVVTEISAEVSGSVGTRKVSASTANVIHYSDFYFGTRPKSSSEREHTFEVCALSPESERVSLAGKTFRATLTRASWDYVLREKTNGSLVCEWQRTDTPCTDFEFDASATELTLPTVFSGDYELKIFDEAGTLIHSREFWHYYGETGTRSSNIAQLAFTFDREKYLPGETAKVTFESPVPGTAILFFGGDKIEGAHPFDVTAGKNVIDVKIPENYVSGSRFFSVNISGKSVAPGKDPSAEDMLRFFGVGVLPVDQTARKIFVKTSVPEVSRPGDKATVQVALTDASGAPVSGHVQLWAVDSGVLSLTGFETPDAFSYFFKTYDCPYLFGDNYSDFCPLMSLDKRLIGGGAALRKYINDNGKTKHSAVAVLDTIAVPESGNATAEFTLPNLDGSLRLMAFALNEEKTGSGQNEMIVRKPISLKISAPRAAAPGDTFEIVGEVFNTDLPAGEFSWRVLQDGNAIANGKTGVLKSGEKFVVRHELTAGTQAGAVDYAIEISDAQGNIVSKDNVALSVRSPLVPRDSVIVSKVESGAEATFPNADEFGDISIGSPVLAVTGALSWLEDYPYGCLEQTVAAAFPQLAVKTLTEAEIVAPIYAESAASKIQTALTQISTMRRGSGMYSMWPGGDSDWDAGTLFTYHFILDADAAGFSMSARQYSEIRNNLMRISNSKKHSLPDRAYAAYLLALSGDRNAAAVARARLMETEYVYEAFSRFLAAAALVKSGHAAEGMAVINRLLEMRFWSHDLRDWDSCLDSSVRRAGLVLRTLSEIAPDLPVNAEIAQFLQNQIRKNGHWGSTQKNAWATLGLTSFLGKDGQGAENALVEVGGIEIPFKKSLKIPGGDAVTVKNIGARPLYVFERTRELPKEATPISAGFEISREYLDEQGTPITECKSGDLITVKIRVRAHESCESAVICDLLPGGLEIEDETLVTRYRSGVNLPKNTAGNYAERARERRFDRFLSFGEFYSGNHSSWTELTYRVRAVSRGKFVIPPVQVESMYEGEKCAVGVSAAKHFIVK